MTVIIIDLFALASIVSKVVEKVILNCISEFLLTTCDQFCLKTSLVLICVPQRDIIKP